MAKDGNVSVNGCLSLYGWTDSNVSDWDGWMEKHLYVGSDACASFSVANNKDISLKRETMQVRKRGKETDFSPLSVAPMPPGAAINKPPPLSITNYSHSKKYPLRQVGHCTSCLWTFLGVFIVFDSCSTTDLFHTFTLQHQQDSTCRLKIIRGPSRGTASTCRLT